MQTSSVKNLNLATQDKRPVASCMILDPFLLRRMELFCKSSGYHFIKITNPKDIPIDLTSNLYLVNSLLQVQLIETKLRNTKQHAKILWVHQESNRTNIQMKNFSQEIIQINFLENSAKNLSLKVFDATLKNILLHALKQSKGNFLPCFVSKIKDNTAQQRTNRAKFFHDQDQKSFETILLRLGFKLDIEIPEIVSDGVYLTCELRTTTETLTQLRNTFPNELKHGNLSLLSCVVKDSSSSIALLLKWSGNLNHSDFKTMNHFRPMLIDKLTYSSDKARENEA